MVSSAVFLCLIAEVTFKVVIVDSLQIPGKLRDIL